MEKKVSIFRGFFTTDGFSILKKQLGPNNEDNLKSKSSSKNVIDSDESLNIEQQLDKNQASQRYNMRTRSNKEPELIEILTSSEEDEDKKNDKQIKKQSNGHQNTQMELFNEFRDETHSFRPWTILHTDIETQIYKYQKASKIAADFQFNISIGFIRFGSFQLDGGYAEFKSNKGITISSKS